jgi:glycosyltransferase involved in cell wall biosynthesis
MMPHDLTVANGAIGSICLVTSTPACLDSHGVPDMPPWRLAHWLSRHGWRVHLLYCGQVPDAQTLPETARLLSAAGIALSHLEALSDHHAENMPQDWSPCYIYRSDRIREALEELHRIHHFDLVEFTDHPSTGFRSLQARRAGLAFQNLRMLVRLPSCAAWLRATKHEWMNEADDLRLDFCERYSFEHADCQLSPCGTMLEYARSIGWKVKTNARVVADIFPEPRFVPASSPHPDRLPEIVYYGPLETGRGLETFLEAVRHLGSPARLAFLGEDGAPGPGTPAAQLLADHLPDRHFPLLAPCKRDQALAYLSEGYRLAVIPWVGEAFPSFVIECVINGIPFLAAHQAGVAEILPDPELQASLLFKPSVRDLRRSLQDYLRLAAEQRTLLTERAQQEMNVATHNLGVVRHYTQLLAEKISTSDSVTLPVLPAPAGEKPLLSRGEDPLVTVVVTHYNLGAYLPEALASLAAQTYANMEVLVIDDGSTCPISARIFTDQEQLYPQFRFLRQANAGLGAARNTGLREARGEYFIPVDADNIVRPHMVERFVAALRRNPDLSAMTCFFLAFRETKDIAGQEFPYAYRPTGGPHVMASFANVYGDANAIFRTADLRAVNGYETDRDLGWEDWEAFVKLVNAGYELDVVPEYLFYYRHRDDSMLRVTDYYRNNQRVLRQYFQAKRLAVAEQIELWTALVSLYHRSEQLRCQVRQLQDAHEPARQQVEKQQRNDNSPPLENRALRYRAVDKLNAAIKRIPLAHPLLKRVVLSGWRARQALKSLTASIRRKAG